MSRKPTGSRDGAANDEGTSLADIRQDPAIASDSSKVLPMTTAPAFDIWLERQIKALFAACDDEPDQALIDLIRHEFAKRDGKVTE
jgi:hypothetical protein